LWNAPSGRIIYQFTPGPSESEDTLYTASVNDTVKKFIKIQAALSNLYTSRSPGVTESFLRAARWQLSFPAAPSLLMRHLTQRACCRSSVSVLLQLLSTRQCASHYLEQCSSPLP